MPPFKKIYGKFRKSMEDLENTQRISKIYGKLRKSTEDSDKMESEH